MIVLSEKLLASKSEQLSSGGFHLVQN
jgi:hypothetical protein